MKIICLCITLPMEKKDRRLKGLFKINTDVLLYKHLVACYRIHGIYHL